MTMIGMSPVERMMREEAARQKAREDWAYRDEMRKLRGKEKPRPAGSLEIYDHGREKRTIWRAT